MKFAAVKAFVVFMKLMSYFAVAESFCWIWMDLKEAGAD